jgi:hypothetical protein
MERVTYGELITRAGQHATRGCEDLAHHPLADVDEAQQALTTFTDLVVTLARHARHLTGPALERHPAEFLPDADPLIIASFRLSTILTVIAHEANRSAPVHPVADGRLPVHLHAATTAVQAATDLLTTHRAADGTWRTPESSVLGDVSIRLTAMDDVAAMVVRLADARPALLRAAHTARVSAAWLITHSLPDLATVRDAAHEVHAISARRARAPAITNWVPADLEIRTTNPMDELGDRLAHLRVAAWRAATYPTTEIGIPELLVFATTAVTIHGTAALAAIHLAGTHQNDPQAPNVVKILLARAESWRRIRAQLLLLDSPSLPDMDLAENAVSVRGLLAGLTFDRSKPTTRRSTVSGDCVSVARSVVVILNRGAGAFEQVAEWNAQTLQSLVARHRVRVPAWTVRGQQGRHLSGLTVSGHPETVTGDFERALITAPDEIIHTLLAAYASAGSGPSLHSPPVSPTPSGLSRFEPPGL